MRRRLTVVGVTLLASFLAMPRLFSGDAVNSYLQWLPLILIVALGEFLVVVSGGIDISVGSTLGCSAMAIGVMAKANPAAPIPLLFCYGAVVGLILGSVNGALVAYAKLPSLIVTIGTLASFRGLAFLIGQGQNVTGASVPDSLMALASKGLTISSITISWLAILSFVFAALTGWFMRFHRLGRAIYAFGSQPEGAIRRGVSASRIQMITFCASGLGAGIGGFFYISRFGQVQPGVAGAGFELTVIAAIAMAGTKLVGGAGKVINVALAALLLSVLTVSLSLLKIDINFQVLVYGLVLLTMVCGEGLRRKKEEVPH